MKKGIHPNYHPVCFVDVSTGKRLLTRSTLTSKEKETIDGVEYYMILRDVTSDSHLVYTKEKRSSSTTSRVKNFQDKYARRSMRAPKKMR